MTILEEIFQRIDAYRNEIIALQTELTSRVALGPENGGEGEFEKSEYLKELLINLEPDQFDEIKVKDERVKCGYRPNLIARWHGRVIQPYGFFLTWILFLRAIYRSGKLIPIK